MLLSGHTRRAALICALCLPGVALADAVVLTPLVAGRGVDADRIGDLFSLMSTELEFMPDVDEVIELRDAPPALNASCLGSTRCLGAITREARGDKLIAGTVERIADEYLMDVLLYDAATNRVVRRDKHTVGTNSGSLISAMPAVLMQTLTGQTPAGAKAEAQMAGVGFDAEDDMAFDPVAPPPAPSPRSEPTTRRIERPVTPPRPPEPVDVPDEDEDDFDPDMFSFGSGTGVETPAPPPPPPRYEPRSSDGYDEYVADRREPSPSGRDRYDDRQGADRSYDDRRSADRGGYDDRRERTAGLDRSTSSSTRATAPKDPTERRRVTVQLRGGLTNYGVFNFGAVTGELGVRIVSGLSFTFGTSVHFVSRELPPAQQQQQGRRVATDVIFPFNAGLIYRFTNTRVRPYAGADVIFAQYFRDPADGSMSFAVGPRGRLGADFMLTDTFGFNADVALGFWSGRDWPRIDPRLRQTGFLPTVGAGIVLAF